MENGNFRQKKNRDEYQSKKDAETDLADSDGRKIRDLPDKAVRRSYSLKYFSAAANSFGGNAGYNADPPEQY